jgi:glucosamine--fructose-6-phosphate aminotransferase (isomerizing)
MLREIYEQPEALARTLTHYAPGGRFDPAACSGLRQWLAETNEIIVVASGSSRHAGLLAELLIEELSGLHVDVEYASEYTYRSQRTLKKSPVIVISQSGETADTLAALRCANNAGLPTLAITNVPGSTMAKEASVSMPTGAGVERAVPATKSFTTQLLNIYLLALLAAESRGALSAEQINLRLAELASLPELVTSQLDSWTETLRVIAPRYAHFNSILYLGRGIHFPIAREGALKLKESAYLHAEGYPSGELKHGPNALVGDNTALVMIATVDHTDTASVRRYEAVLQLMRDMRTQGATILALANTGDSNVPSLATDTIPIFEAGEPLLAISETVPLQLLAYFVATNNGVDVDHPRNLSKAVLTI